MKKSTAMPRSRKEPERPKKTFTRMILAVMTMTTARQKIEGLQTWQL